MLHTRTESAILSLLQLVVSTEYHRNTTWKYFFFYSSRLIESPLCILFFSRRCSPGKLDFTGNAYVAKAFIG